MILLTSVLTRIPILFVVFVIFLLVINFRFRKSNREQQNAEDAFWERERQANSTRKKDISNLPYISIPIEIIPQNLHTAAEATLISLCEKQILNLTGKTNTDLKLEYGVANLEFLSQCDDNFSDLVTSLSDYSKELLDADQTDDAVKIMEFGVSVGADAKPLYIRLANYYQENGQASRIDELIQKANELNSLSKNSIVADLKALQ